jgi:hypothetical protein
MMKRIFSVATSFLILQNLIHSQNFIMQKMKLGVDETYFRPPETIYKRYKVPL